MSSSAGTVTEAQPTIIPVITRPAGSLRLHDPLWAGIPGIELVDVASGRRPRWATTLQVAATPDFLWVRYRCRAAEVLATLTRPKDKVWTEDAVELFLWPDGADSLVELQISPRGVVRDLLVHRPFTEQPTFDDSWCCEGLVSAAEVLKRPGKIAGWVALFGVPLGQVGRGPAGLFLGAFRVDRHPPSFSALRSTPSFERFHDRALLLPLGLGHLGIEPGSA